MNTQQKQSIEAYQRVQAFLEEHPLPPPATYAAPKDLLDDVVARLTTHSNEQTTGGRLLKAQDQRQRALARVLREQHLRPIAIIASAVLRDVPGIDKATRMPAAMLTTTKLLAEAAAFRQAAAPYAEVFIRNGRPVDFLAQLDAAAADLHQAQVAKAKNQRQKVGARAGIQEQIVRGRQAVDMLSAIVTTSFAGNKDVLAKWRNSKRLRGFSNGSGASGESSVQAPALAVPSAPAPTSAAPAEPKAA